MRCAHSAQKTQVYDQKHEAAGQIILVVLNLLGRQGLGYEVPKLRIHPGDTP